MGNKLELTWYGKEEQVKIEPRLLIHDSSKDYGDVDSENMLIHGDNLLALKALEKDYAGQVKCIYIESLKGTGRVLKTGFDHQARNLISPIIMDITMNRILSLNWTIGFALWK